MPLKFRWDMRASPCDEWREITGLEPEFSTAQAPTLTVRGYDRVTAYAVVARPGLS
jgi:hypothetical protein